MVASSGVISYLLVGKCTNELPTSLTKIVVIFTEYIRYVQPNRTQFVLYLAV